MTIVAVSRPVEEVVTVSAERPGCVGCGATCRYRDCEVCSGTALCGRCEDDAATGDAFLLSAMQREELECL